MLNQPLLHIVVAGHDSRFRSQLDSSVAIRIRDREDVVVHWVAAGAAENRMGEPLADALQHVAVCLPELDAICVLDSALHSKAVTRFRLQRGAGPAASRVLALCDGRAESGVETVFRLRASGAGYRFRCQVVAPGGGRFDFLFGDRLVVEVDGSEFHSGHAEFIRDRERDAWYAAIGYYVVRLTYSQVVHRWHEVESLLRLVLARGEHVWPARIRTPATSLGVSSVDRGAAGADSETAQKAGAGSRPQKAGHRAEPRAR
jgi:very-short-patch-repair endonuclease